MKKLITMLFIINSIATLAQSPVSCTTTLPPFDNVREGEITSEIRIAKEFYIDRGRFPLEVGRAKLDSVTSVVFRRFITKRTNEYNAVRCHYKGVDWNQAGGSSWRTITCVPGFTFVTTSLVRTQNGDWKGGPNWGLNNTSMSWKTGGYRRSETHVDIDAVYFDIPNKVITELNIARKKLFDLGIPTKLPNE